MRVQGPWALLLDQDIIEKFKNNLSKVLNGFENIMEIEAFAPKEQTLLFHNIFKYILFQRCQNALLWGKG